MKIIKKIIFYILFFIWIIFLANFIIILFILLETNRILGYIYSFFKKKIIYGRLL